MLVVQLEIRAIIDHMISVKTNFTNLIEKGFNNFSTHCTAGFVWIPSHLGIIGNLKSNNLAHGLKGLQHKNINDLMPLVRLQKCAVTLQRLLSNIAATGKIEGY